MSFLTPAVFAVYHVVAGLAAVLVPILGGAGPAAAIVIFTAGIRLCLHPLNRAQMRAQASSQKARAALAPAVQKLQRKYRNDPSRVQRETLELYRTNGVSLAPGMLQGLAQMPVFFVVYRMFESPSIAGHHNSLLSDQLFGVGLGSHFADVFRGPVLIPGHIAVFVLLLAAIAAVATWAFIRARSSAPSDLQSAQSAPFGAKPGAQPGAPSDASAAGVARLMAWLPFGTVVTAAILPLAVGLYLATSTLWTVAERRHLQKAA